ncbi:MAG: RNA methyltransferase [Pyrinomonadaceae bacterium]
MPLAEEITSRSNERLKAVKRVRDGKDTERFVVEGRRLFFELGNSTIQIEAVFATKEFIAKHDRISELRSGDSYQLFPLSDSLLSTISETKNPQGVVAVCRRPAFSPLEHSKGSEVAILLHNLSNPGNLGAVIRTAEAFEASYIGFSGNCCDPFHPAAVRASMGSVFRSKLISKREYFEAVAKFREAGFVPIAADIKGASSYRGALWPSSPLIIMGSEAHGLDDSELEAADHIFRIPINTSVESLNISVAAGILLSEAAFNRS